MKLGHHLSPACAGAWREENASTSVLKGPSWDPKLGALGKNMMEERVRKVGQHVVWCEGREFSRNFGIGISFCGVAEPWWPWSGRRGSYGPQWLQSAYELKSAKAIKSRWEQEKQKRGATRVTQKQTGRCSVGKLLCRCEQQVWIPSTHIKAWDGDSHLYQ